MLGRQSEDAVEFTDEVGVERGEGVLLEETGGDGAGDVALDGAAGLFIVPKDLDRNPFARH